MSWWVGNGWFVYGPIGKRKDGEWSKREIVLAYFYWESWARAFHSLLHLMKIPVRLVEKRDPR